MGDDSHIIAAVKPRQDFFCVFDYNGQAGCGQYGVKGDRFQWAVLPSYMEIVACFSTIAGERLFFSAVFRKRTRLSTSGRFAILIN